MPKNVTIHIKMAEIESRLDVNLGWRWHTDWKQEELNISNDGTPTKKNILKGLINEESAGITNEKINLVSRRTGRIIMNDDQ